MSPTQLEAELARHQLSRRLLDAAGRPAHRLAAVLDRCSSASPCRSAACPACGLRFQRVAVEAHQHFIGEPARAVRNRRTAVTIAPGAGWVAPGDLTVEAVEEVGRQIMAALADLDLPPALVSLEVSFNEDATGRIADHWGPHGHTLHLDWLTNEQKKALRRRFTRSEVVRRPVKIQELDDNPRGHRYPFKPQRVRRVTYIDDSNSTRGPHLATKHRDLRPWQAVALALADHELGFSRRLLSHGFSREALQRHLEGLGWPRDGP